MFQKAKLLPNLRRMFITADVHHRIQGTSFVCALLSLFSVDSGDQKIKMFCTFFGFSAREEGCEAATFGNLFGAQLYVK
jgi:hypothetical protein